jgi:hypothetical protein
LYQYEELSETAKAKARDWYREGDDTFESFTYLNVYEDAQRMAEILGITFDLKTVPLHGGGTRTEPKIYYTGFSSQGDGACFEGQYAYAKGCARKMAAEAPEEPTDYKGYAGNRELNRIARGLTGLQRLHGYKLIAVVKHTGHYSHAYATTIDVYQGEDERAPDSATETKVVELLRAFMNWIYRSLEVEYEYQQSDEQVAETIQANEYEFTAEGERA